MSKIKKIFKRLFIWVFLPILFLLLLGTIWLFTSPEFGGSHSKEDVERYRLSKQYEGEVFKNIVPTSMDMGFSDILSVLKEYMNGIKRDPEFELPIEKVSASALLQNRYETKIMWFGHSAVLLQIDGKNVLLDPMLGESPAPHPVVGTKRYYSELPIEIDSLPTIDLVLISHDHYDHLDYGSIMKLKDKTKLFVLPLGVAAHFRSWGIEESKLVEMDWWEELEAAGLQLAFLPSRHFSGRALADRNHTLWGSFRVKGKKDNIYFSGDGGYAEHFKAIGAKYGPFDFAMLECGQYHEKWAQIHMMPEETAQAGIDIRAKRIMPIHWGAFTLSLHHWTDPILRVKKKAQELNLPIVHPKIGSYFSISDSSFDRSEWWVKSK